MCLLVESNLHVNNMVSSVTHYQLMFYHAMYGPSVYIIRFLKYRIHASKGALN